MKCTEIVLSGHRCREEVRTSPVTQSEEWCYYHGKVHDGLCSPSEPINILMEDDD